MSSRGSALNSAALFAGGAVVGTGLYSLVRSMTGSQDSTNTQSADAPSAKAENSVPEGLGAAAGAKLKAAADATAKAATDVVAKVSPESAQPQKKTKLAPEPENHAPAALKAAAQQPVGRVDEDGIYLPPASDEVPDYNNCGSLGVPYEPRTKQAPVPLQDQRVQLTAAMPGAQGLQAPLDLSRDVLATSLQAVETLAYQHSGTIFVYESAVTGFGQLCEARASESASHAPTVLSMETRAGAGQAIAGYLAGEGSAEKPAASQRATVSVLTNAQGLLAMGPALSLISTKGTDLVVHVSTASQVVSGDLSLRNDYASTLTTAAMLGDHGYEVLLSATPQDAVDVAKYAYSRGSKAPLVHILDGAFAGAELGRIAPSQGVKPEPFAYTGPNSPETVLVIPNGSLAARARTLLLSLPSPSRSKVGVLSVRSLHPWEPKALRHVLPGSVKTLRVVEEAFSTLGGALYAQVLEASLSGALSGGESLAVQSLVLQPGQELSVLAWYELFQEAASSSRPLDLATVLSKAPSSSGQVPDLLKLSSAHLVTFFGADRGSSPAAATELARALMEGGASSVRELSRFDNFAAGGAVRADVVFSERRSVDLPMDVLARQGQSHVVVVSEPAALLQSYQLLESVREDGIVIFNAAGWTPEDVQTTLCEADIKLLINKHVQVYLLDVQAAVEQLTSEVDAKGKGEAATDAQAALVLLGALLKAFSVLEKPTARAAATSNVPLMQAAQKSLAKVDLVIKAAEGEAPERLVSLSYNNVRALESEPSSRQIVRATWARPAWQLLFREAYTTQPEALRPDLPEKTYNIKVSVNKRLTPLEYDRYLFHMELDTTGTDLKYEVGEALGVHGWNDDNDVSDFIQWSGYDPEEVLLVPSVTTLGATESRTVFQTLQQTLDIFGKPPKSFFEALGKEVKSREEARWLRFISSAEGSSTFKKLSESETVTYVDVLHMFPSARVSMDWLLQNVELIKPRHYSIASAQVAVGNSVHLLIVTVDWKTPQGGLRFGQCTRYLSRLRPGTKVTVSLRPSVMKLPPLDTQPIIMAGLGTGAAPFRAFLQARAYQKAQGKEIGPMYYYFGSRHRAMEYMYGEELEAYLADGVLTHLGLAFSRDQKNKVYIQHKITEDGRQLTEHLVPELLAKDGEKVDDGRKGVFTLCGPVWPVPDIQEALVTAFIEHGWTREQAENTIAELKEEERYVLEVY